MQSILNTITSRLYHIWPVLLGLSAAYVLAGFAEYRSPSHAIPRMNVTDLPANLDRPSWEGVIFRKNILNLEMPVDKPETRESDPRDEMEGWKLLGTFTGERDLALVSVNDQTKLLSEGQSAEGWELSAILPELTQWKSGARTRTLSMWLKEEDPDPPASPPPSVFTPGQPGAQRVTLSSRDIQPFLNDPNSLLQMAQFKPYSREGEMSGFQVSNIRGDSILRKLGLRNGDILTRIDGRPITGPTELLQAYSSLGNSTLVSMDILRRGQNVSFLIEIE